jgi:hypothetical protein
VPVRLREEVQGLLWQPDDKLNPSWCRKKLGGLGVHGRLCRLAAAGWSKLTALGSISDKMPSMFSREGLIEAAKLGRLAGHSPKARAKQAEKQHRRAAAAKAWNCSDQPGWLTEHAYRTEIQPRLSGIKVRAISTALGISEPYAAEIRGGRYLPHARQCLTLARLVGVGPALS